MRLKHPFKALLISFLVRKHKIIKNITGVDYMTVEDITEVKNWSMHIINDILKHLDVDDNKSCPWCRLFYFGCGTIRCGYGTRHGYCIKYPNRAHRELNLNSTYGKIISDLNTKAADPDIVYIHPHPNLDISHLTDIRNLVREIKATYVSLKTIYKYQDISNYPTGGMG